MRLYMAVVLVLIVTLLYGLRALRRKTTAMLEQVLYKKQAPSLYLELLKNPRFKLLYRKSTILLFQLDAYLVMNDQKEIEEQIKLISTLPLTKPEKLDFYMKKLSYFCIRQDALAASVTLKEWRALLGKQKSEQARLLLNEGEVIYRLYIDHDQSLVSLFHDELKTCDGYRKGLTYFRLAKLAFDRQDMDETSACLQKANNFLKDSTWQGIIREAMNDPAILKTR